MWVEDQLKEHPLAYWPLYSPSLIAPAPDQRAGLCLAIMPIAPVWRRKVIIRPQTVSSSLLIELYRGYLDVFSKGIKNLYLTHVTEVETLVFLWHIAHVAHDADGQRPRREIRTYECSHSVQCTYGSEIDEMISIQMSVAKRSSIKLRLLSIIYERSVWSLGSNIEVKQLWNANR